MEPEPITPLAPRAVGRTVFTQTWADLTFLHWAVDPDRVAAYLPPGVRPDTIDGKTYVALVPFRMQGIGVLGSPGIPYFGDFLETNVRLYSVDEQGRRGVVFVSLDADRLAPVLVARLGPRLPYLWSAMGYERAGDQVTYTCRRRPSTKRLSSSPVVPAGANQIPQHTATSRIRVAVGEKIPADQVGELEHWLTARWGLHLSGFYWPNQHPTWPLHQATLLDLDDAIMAAAGFGDLTARDPDSVLFSPGVYSTFGPRVR